MLKTYYKPKETSLYYLQSRYYDASVGRFVNADDIQFVVVCAESLRTNLWSYCKNELINHEDQDGRDAVWLQASKNVAGLGHTGLIFKYGEKWYYWYWGPNLKSAITGYITTFAWYLLKGYSLIGSLYKVAATTVLATYQIIAVSSKKTLTNTEARNLANKYSGGSDKASFDKSLYIKGNFNSAYRHFRKLSTTKNYNLLFNNCMQTTVDGLYKGTFAKNNFANHLRLITARGLIVPNFAYGFMDKYF